MNTVYKYVGIFIIIGHGEGILAIADLFEGHKSDKSLPALYHSLRQWEQAVHKQWFAVDSVKLVSDAQLHASLSVRIVAAEVFAELAWPRGCNSSVCLSGDACY